MQYIVNRFLCRRQSLNEVAVVRHCETMTNEHRNLKIFFLRVITKVIIQLRKQEST